MKRKRVGAGLWTFSPRAAEGQGERAQMAGRAWCLSIGGQRFREDERASIAIGFDSMVPAFRVFPSRSLANSTWTFSVSRWDWKYRYEGIAPLLMPVRVGAVLKRESMPSASILPRTTMGRELRPRSRDLGRPTEPYVYTTTRRRYAGPRYNRPPAAPGLQLLQPTACRPGVVPTNLGRMPPSSREQRERFPPLHTETPRPSPQ
jgi:hypothetical protein